MKILATSDWHMDAVTAGRRRLYDFREYRTNLVHAIGEEKPDVVAVLGDYFDPGSMLVHGLTVELFDTIYAIAESFDGAVIVIAGNHDVIETSEGHTTISPLSKAIECGAFQNLTAEVLTFEIASYHAMKGYRILALPYMSRAMVSGSSQDMDQFLAKVKRSGDPGPLLVFGHMTVPGAVIGSESQEMARGRDLDMPELADLDPALVMNGHYHSRQIVRHGGVDVVIPGSPMRFNFGEAGDDCKGYTIAEV